MIRFAFCYTALLFYHKFREKVKENFCGIVWPLQGQAGHPVCPLQSGPLPALAGEQKQLLLRRQLPQQIQRQSQTLIVKTDQRVVQHNGRFLGQAQTADRQAYRQIQLVRGAPGQGQRAAGPRS